MGHSALVCWFRADSPPSPALHPTNKDRIHLRLSSLTVLDEAHSLSAPSHAARFVSGGWPAWRQGAALLIASPTGVANANVV
eukprot:1715739-Rhodomonas_salina.2